MRRSYFSLILAALLLVILPLSAAAAPQSGVAGGARAQGTGIYVVRQGDTLFSIASRHCMTTNELMSLNAGVISNPNQIWPGMQLRVVNRCGGGGNQGGGNWGNVCDRGPTQHAQGGVSGNRYFVARGDTSFSIANRFGISVTALCQANGINPWNIWAGQTLIIPGLTGACGGGCPPGNWNCPPNNCWNCPPNNCWNCPPPATPTPTPAPNNCWNCPPNNCWNCPPNNCPNCPPNNCPNCRPPNPCPNCPVLTPGPWPTVVPVTPVPSPQAPFLVVEQPLSGQTLPRVFIVSGRGGGLVGGNVVVVAQTATGQELARQATTLQGNNGGAGGQGTFSVQLTTPTVTTNTPGWIIVWSPQSRVDPQFTQVTFTPGG